MSSNPFLKPAFAALLIAASSPFTPALAADAPTGAEAQYQRDRIACMAQPEASAARETCLREAGAAREAAASGELSNEPAPSELQRNAQSRCTVHLDPVDRAACIRMVQGEGASQGSVEAGGVIRETITVLPPPSPSAAPQGNASPSQ